MATKMFLNLNCATSRCLITGAQYYRPKLCTLETYKQVRNFKKLRSNIKKNEINLSNAKIEQGQLHFSKLWKPFAFTVVFSGSTFLVAAIFEYERIRKHTYRIINRYKEYAINKTGWRRDFEVAWRNLSEGQRMFAPICFLNVIVFLAWRVPMLNQTMMKYFCTTPSSRVLCWPMLLSAFSHYSFLHLAANMCVLHSFSHMAVQTLGKEQFVAFYLTSGVISSFTSYLYKTMVGVCSPSLGASGAIMGIIGLICTQYPETYLSIIFLPMYNFKAGTVIKGIIGFDLMGCILQWKIFDHAAHLGGVLFGIFWQMWGNANLWQQRKPVLSFWHQLRGSSKS